jgi:hypothetical protein
VIKKAGHLRDASAGRQTSRLTRMQVGANGRSRQAWVRGLK